VVSALLGAWREYGVLDGEPLRHIDDQDLMRIVEVAIEGMIARETSD
jgi:hypothetical protein